MLDLLGDKNWRIIKCRYLLTPRETQTARLICRGLNRREIAEIMGLPITVVHNYQHQVFTKVGVNRAIKLLLKCLEVLAEANTVTLGQVQADIVRLVDGRAAVNEK